MFYSSNKILLTLSLIEQTNKTGEHLMAAWISIGERQDNPGFDDSNS